MLTRTHHFNERWRERVGTPPPSEAELEAAIKTAARAQGFRTLYTGKGRRVKVLAIYWLREWNVLVKIDMEEKRAVTVVPPDLGWGPTENFREGCLFDKTKKIA